MKMKNEIAGNDQCIRVFMYGNPIAIRIKNIMLKYLQMQEIVIYFVFQSTFYEQPVTEP
jgi:hypothetical protein